MPGEAHAAFIVICHYCTCPTFIDPDKQQYPRSLFGAAVSDVPDNSVAAMYDEARRSFGAASFTAAVLCCRKLLMHIAVSKGAAKNLRFVDYVKYLAANHYVPPDAKGWVDHIRKRSNEANHEIVLMDETDAKELIEFSEMLLKVIYEFPAVAERRIKPPKATS